jgi:hypothetical protein
LVGLGVGVGVGVSVGVGLGVDVGEGVGCATITRLSTSTTKRRSVIALSKAVCDPAQIFALGLEILLNFFDMIVHLLKSKIPYLQYKKSNCCIENFTSNFAYNVKKINNIVTQVYETLM